MIREQRWISPAPDVELWAEATGEADDPAILLIMGANETGIAWPDELVDHLASHQRVIRYDHRDTGRSTHRFEEQPYAIRDLAPDAVAVLDGFGIQKAHVVGMSMGGFLVQLLLLDAPQRLLSATLLCTGALEAEPPLPGTPELPGPPPQLLAMWEKLAEARDRETDIAFNVQHWRLLSGQGQSFRPEEFIALEERIREHRDADAPSFAHAVADQSGLARGAELAGVTTPTLVIEAPLDPVFGPPNAPWTASVINGARLITIPGMGHAICAANVPALAEAILSPPGVAVEGAGPVMPST